jgi:hypothetical protein
MPRWSGVGGSGQVGGGRPGRNRASGIRWPQSVCAFRPCRRVLVPTHGPLGRGCGVHHRPSPDAATPLGLMDGRATQGSGVGAANPGLHSVAPLGHPVPSGDWGSTRIAIPTPTPMMRASCCTTDQRVSRCRGTTAVVVVVVEPRSAGKAPMCRWHLVRSAGGDGADRSITNGVRRRAVCEVRLLHPFRVL